MSLTFKDYRMNYDLKVVKTILKFLYFLYVLKLRNYTVHFTIRKNNVCLCKQSKFYCLVQSTHKSTHMETQFSSNFDFFLYFYQVYNKDKEKVGQGKDGTRKKMEQGKDGKRKKVG